jgi:hypothetical protein
MARGFLREKETVVAAFTSDEARVLGLVIAQVAGLVQAHGGAGKSGRAPESGMTLASGVFGEDAVDPAVARLFPDGYRDDPEAAAELRSLTEGSLRSHKLQALTAMIDSLPLDGGEVQLDLEAGEAWLLALNDARLVIGTRLDLTDETDLTAEPAPRESGEAPEPQAIALDVYRFLTYLQETLVVALQSEQA